MNQVGSLDSDILSTFDHHQPTPHQVDRIHAIRAAAKQFATAIMLYVPHGADRTAAIRQAHEAMMTANKGIACDSEQNQKQRAYAQQLGGQIGLSQQDMTQGLVR